MSEELPKLVTFKIPEINEDDTKKIHEVSKKVMKVLTVDQEFKNSKLSELLSTLDFFFKDKSEIKKLIGDIDNHTKELIIRIAEGKLNNAIDLDELMEICVLNKFKDDPNTPFDCSKKLPDLFKNIFKIFDEYGGIEEVSKLILKSREMIIKELQTENGLTESEARADVHQEMVTINIPNSTKGKKDRRTNRKRGRRTNRKRGRRTNRKRGLRSNGNHKYSGLVFTLPTLIIGGIASIFFPPLFIPLVVTAVILDILFLAKIVKKP